LQRRIRCAGNDMQDAYCHDLARPVE
jgi:hypothetical protein